MAYQRRPVPSRERYLQEKQALGDGIKKPWAGLRLSDVGIFLSQHCQDLRKSVTKRKKLKDLLANRDELFLVNTGKGKKNNPYVYLKGTMVPFTCPFLRDEGECTFGENCHYHHNTSPLRQKEETSMQKHIQES